MRSTLLLLLLFIGFFLHGQSDPVKDSLSSYYDMNLEDLQKLKSSGVSSEIEKLINSLISVASQKAMSTRETPGIVSLVTADEIQQSGARDLTDVLRLIPGFDFAYDGESSLGIGIRGNWANDGKILFLIDGQQMNEIFRGSLSFGNHFPVNMISKIEIIRGPGSAIYGGFAELGVINIITKKGSELNGLMATGTYGQTRSVYARRNIELGWGKKMNDWEFSITGIVGEGNRSNRSSFLSQMGTPTIGNNYTGNYSSLIRQSKDDPLMANVKISYRGWNAKTIFDSYRSTILTVGDQKGNRFLYRRNNSFNGELSYDWKISSKVLLTPRLNYINQIPTIAPLPDTLAFSQEYGERIKGGVTLSYTPNRRTNLVIGTEVYRDQATNSEDSIRTVDGVVRSISYRNYAAFTQGTYKHRLANVIIGARYDYNSNYGDAFVPRVGVTKKFNKFNSKLLYSQSFRAPTFQNIARGVTDYATMAPGIRPEKTEVIELETGYQLSKDQFVSLNLFNSVIRHPIVYNSTLLLYTNYSQSGTRGFELDYKIKQSRFALSANYSFYSVSGKKKVESYTTQIMTERDSITPSGGEANQRVLLAFPAHKVNLKAAYKVTRHLEINGTLTYYSNRYGYELAASNQATTYHVVLQKYSPSVLSHIFLSYKQLVKGLDAGVGLYNITNAKLNYLTPSYSRNGSLPYGSREWMVRLTYSLTY